MEWSHTDEQLHALLELLEVWHYEWLTAHTEKNKRHSIPKPVPRPRPFEGTAEPEPAEVEPRRLSSRAELASFFGRRYVADPTDEGGGLPDGVDLRPPPDIVDDPDARRAAWGHDLP